MTAKLLTFNRDACTDPRVSAMFDALGVPEHLRPGARPWVIGTRLDECVECPRCKGRGKVAIEGGGEVECPSGRDGYTWRRYPHLLEKPPLIHGGLLDLTREAIIWDPWLAGFIFGSFDFDRAFATRAEAEDRLMVLSAEEEQEWRERWAEEGVDV